jgi:Do/DeqQ family serine protease
LVLYIELLKLKRMKKIASLIIASVLGGILALGGYVLLVDNYQKEKKVSQIFQPKITQTNYIPTSNFAAETTDFTKVADETIHTVVHVKNTTIRKADPLAEFFYGSNAKGGKITVGTGSGVIISPDGYIITNNHVIQGAKELEITLNNKKSYTAEVIGVYESSDVALIKINASNLPYITFGNSDNVKVGEWVLAVGNPFNLTSTVTAGIVSAKGRDLEGNNNIDSFIQTDAAVNPGNSGGALVNTRGELIGINTAITSRTGSFIGYSFAIPSNIVKKVVEDIMEFGMVQKAILGVSGGELNHKVAENLNIDFTQGFYISEVTENSGAKKAGLRSKDIIIKLNDVKILTYADLTGYLRTKKPNDIINVTFLRDGIEKTTEVTLTKSEMSSVSSLGLDLENLTDNELKRLAITNGVKIIGISNKELLYYGVKKGYIIISINNKKVYSVEDVNNVIDNRSDGEVMRIEMLNTKGERERYIFR